MQLMLLKKLQRVETGRENWERNLKNANENIKIRVRFVGENSF